MTPPLTVLEAIHQRRSIKTFKTDPIPDEVLEKILKATILAPSSWNFQPTRIVLVQNSQQKQALYAACWNQKQILQAPLTLVFAASIRGWEEKMDKILETSVQLGAIPQTAADFIRQNAPPFQDALGEKEREYAIKDAMIAATHAVLAAESLGIGSCLMNGWVEDQVKKVIGVGADPDVAIAVVVPLGYPAEIPKFQGRLAQNEVVFIDRFS